MSGATENSAAAVQRTRPVQSGAKSPAAQRAMQPSGDRIQLSDEAIAAMSRSSSGSEASTVKLATPPVQEGGASAKGSRAVASYLNC